jgi:hypothetical protein
MLRNRSLYLLCGLLAGGAVGACQGEEDVQLSGEIPCSSDNPCPEGSSCLVNKCVGDGSLKEDQTCSRQQQCGDKLICFDFVCTLGCTDLYYLDECVDETWCKPTPGEVLVTASGEEVPVGQCAPSECDPQTETECEPNVACVAITETIGACLPYCEYGFAGGTYFDTCDDTDANHACQPLGLTHAPVCMIAGGTTAPPVGAPGCDAVRNPCSPGSICFNVVCRRLCAETQPEPARCEAGQTCATVGGRADLSYCRSE